MKGAMKITVDTVEVQKMLGNMIDASKNYQEPLERAGEQLLGLYGDKVFKDQASQGLAWKPLSPATLLMRENRTGYYAQAPVETGKIMVWTGRLMNGFKQKAERFKLTINNTVDYFKYQQKKRRVLYVNAEVIDTVVQEIIKHNNEAIK